MKKLINDVFIYRDWRLVIINDFFARISANPRYSLRAYARDLDFSPGFISKILNGNKVPSQNSALKIFSRIGLNEDEVNYAKYLFIKSQSQNSLTVQEAEHYIKSKNKKIGFNDNSERNKFTNSLNHFLVYAIVRKISNLNKIFAVCEKLDIPQHIVSKIIEEFINEGYFTRSKETLTVSDRYITSSEVESTVKISDELNRLISKKLLQEGTFNSLNNTHVIALTLNKNSFDSVHEAHKLYLRTLSQISDSSQNIDRIVFITNSFMTVISDNLPPESSH